MSLDYYIGVMLGYKVKRDDFDALFLHDIPAISHLAKKYDPDTGAYLGEKQVIDRDEISVYALTKDEALKLKDPEQYSEAQFFDELTNLIHSQCFIFDNESWVYFGVNDIYDEEAIDLGRVCGGDPINYAKAILASIILEAMKINLEKLGLKVGQPQIMVNYSVS